MTASKIITPYWEMRLSKIKERNHLLDRQWGFSQMPKNSRGISSLPYSLVRAGVLKRSHVALNKVLYTKPEKSKWRVVSWRNAPGLCILHNLIQGEAQGYMFTPHSSRLASTALPLINFSRVLQPFASFPPLYAFLPPHVVFPPLRPRLPVTLHHSFSFPFIQSSAAMANGKDTTISWRLSYRKATWCMTR